MINDRSGSGLTLQANPLVILFDMAYPRKFVKKINISLLYFACTQLCVEVTTGLGEKSRKRTEMPFGSWMESFIANFTSSVKQAFYGNMEANKKSHKRRKM